MDQGAGKHGLLLHAPRESLAAVVSIVPQAENLEQVFGPLSRDRRFDIPEAGDELEILPNRELVVEQRLVGKPGDHALGRDRISTRVDIEQADLARIRIKQAGDHAQRCGLAGAVGAEQGIEFPAPDLETDAIHGLLAAIALGEAAHLQRVWHELRHSTCPPHRGDF